MSNKQWISAWSFIVIAVFSSLFVLVSLLESYGIPLRFTNSISYDAKINFLRNHVALLNESSTIVLGSSMGLNDIDSAMLEKTAASGKVINLSSWGLHASEVFQFLKLIDLKNTRYLVFSAQFFDLCGQPLKEMDQAEIRKYIYGDFSIYPYIQTVLTLPRHANAYLHWNEYYRDKENYTNLEFDEYGDVPMNIPKQRIDPDRWDVVDEDYAVEDLNFEALLELNTYLKERGITLIVARPPYRQPLLDNNPALKRIFDTFGESLSRLSKENDFIFLDAHALLHLDDSYFVDKSHLNLAGADIYSTAIAARLAALHP